MCLIECRLLDPICKYFSRRNNVPNRSRMRLEFFDRQFETHALRRVGVRSNLVNVRHAASRTRVINMETRKRRSPATRYARSSAVFHFALSPTNKLLERAPTYKRGDCRGSQNEYFIVRICAHTFSHMRAHIANFEPRP